MATIEISQSPSTKPANEPYVLSVKVQIEDPALRVRQDAWNAQWQRQSQPNPSPNPQPQTQPQPPR